MSIFVIFLLLSTSCTLANAQTRVGYYSRTCPRAESIVTSSVKSAFQSNPTIAPGLLRMHFHDCFVNGCDASILIDGPNTEKTAPPNGLLRGFEVIDDAKRRIEAICPGVVSCADILALAARDSVVLTRGISWSVPTGRRDGLVSLANGTSSLPGFRDSVTAQKNNFRAQGLNTQDLVTLVGGHTIGTAACVLFSYRLQNFTANGGPDPSINPTFLAQLLTLCPPGDERNKTVSANRRCDGLVSLANGTSSLPGARDSVTAQKNKFRAQGLSTQDLVTLVGGHTIGTAACVLFSYRLQNFTANGGPDPSINPAFLAQLRTLCPQGGNPLRRVALDDRSEGRFDNSFFTNLRVGKGVLESDQVLWSDASTREIVQRFLGIKGLAAFNAEFRRSMVKMSNIKVKTGKTGEIRIICTAMN